MSDIKNDLPDITVNIVPGIQQVTDVTPSEIYQVDVNVGDIYSVDLQNPNIITATANSNIYELAQIAGYAIYAGTSSYALTAQSLVASGNLEYANFSASNDAYIGHNLVVGNSATIPSITGSITNAISASYALTASYVSGAASISASYALTASYVEGAASDWNTLANKPQGIVSNSIQVQLDQINGSTFANHDFTFPQNLIIDGTLTAKEYHLEVVSSSVIYDSGSTKFGDSPDDTHQFTGSVQVDGTIWVMPGAINDLTSSYAIQAENIGVIFAGTYETGSDIIYNPNGITHVINADYAITASYAMNGGGGGIVNIDTGSFATTGSNLFIGNQQIDGTIYLGQTGNSSIYTTNIGNILYVSSNQDMYIQAGQTLYLYSDNGTTVAQGDFSATNLSATYNVNASGYVNTPLLYNGGPIEIRSYYQPLQINSNGAGILLNDNVSITGSINFTNNSVVGDTVTSTVNGTPIQINYGITKGDINNRFGGIKIKDYQWSGTNLASQIEFWTDSEAQNFSTRRFYIDGFGKSVFTSNVEVTGSLTVSGSSTFKNIGPTILSGSLNVTNGITGSFTGSINGSITSASYATTASYAMNGGGAADWTSLTGKPAGLVSSSTQATSWSVATASLSTSASFATTSSFATTASYALNSTSLPSGTVSSSVQINTGSFTGSFIGTHSGSTFGTASWASNVISASYATTASYALNASTVPAGTISSSIQFNSLTAPFTGSFTGSFIGSLTGAITSASFATTASYALSATATPVSGTVSSSTQIINALPVGTVSSSTQVNGYSIFATTGSNTFTAGQTISGSLTVTTGTVVASAITANTSSLYLTSGSNLYVQNNAAVEITGSLVVTGSFVLPMSASPSPQTGSMFFSGSFIYVYTGTQYRSASLA